MKKYLLAFITLISPLFTYSQETAEVGLDEKINDAFMPIADWWEGFVLTTVPVGEYNVPFVVILLV
jgi:AGCS family alanine or glycine:cation symporter